MNAGITQFEWQRWDELVSKANNIQIREMQQRIKSNVEQRLKMGEVL